MDKNRQKVLWILPCMLIGLALLGPVLSPARGATASEPESSPTPEPVVWSVQRPASVQRASLEFRVVREQKMEGDLEIAGRDGEPLILSKDAVLTATDVVQVEVALEPDLVHYAVTLHFTPEAAQRFHKVTTDNVGKRLAILVNGQVWEVPFIRFPLDSSVMISSNYSRAAATEMAEQLAP